MERNEVSFAHTASLQPNNQISDVPDQFSIGNLAISLNNGCGRGITPKDKMLKRLNHAGPLLLGVQTP